MATAHTARTVHHTVSGDRPPAPGAGNVRTQRATCGTRLGAISTSTTAVPATGPGSPVRVRAAHAAAKPSRMLPASARPAAAQGSACPRRAAASSTTAPAASSAKQTGSSTVAAAGNAAPQPPTTTATPVTPATAGQAPARSTGPVITW
jgi:hypothetical protein